MAEIELNRHEAADGDLPPVCAYCGAPAGGYRTKVFRGTTPFTRFSRFWCTPQRHTPYSAASPASLTSPSP